MNKLLRAASTAVLALSVCATNAFAAGPWYAGAKIGSVDIDVPGVSNATNLGVTVGYNINKNVAIEGELTTSMSDGDIEGFLDYSVNSYAVYVAGRFGDKAYFKVKGGYADTEIDTDFGSESDSGFSFGIGGGYKISDQASIEAEYTQLYDDNDFSIDFLSVGFNYTF